MSTSGPNDPTVVPEATEPTEIEATVEPAAEPQAAEGPKAEPKPEPPPPDYREIRIQTLERALAEREATLHSYIRAHKQAQQEFEAYKQRLERDRERELTAAKAKLVERLLEVDDNLERTLAAARKGGPHAQPGPANVDALIAGAEMVHRLFIERMTELGLERVDPTGKPFDPTSMEALGAVAVDDPAKNDVVVATLRSGYRIGDREIRPALVQVGKFFS